ncbi:MAG: DUF2334 domain-containing protein [Planctomycetota bacterium]|jgi:hypothetical protein
MGYFYLLLIVCISAVSAERYIVFRYDDFYADLPQARADNPIRQQIWQAEQQMEVLFKTYNMPYVVGVIPRANIHDQQPDSSVLEHVHASLHDDPEKVEFLKQGIQDGRIEIAQHGYTHTNHSDADSPPSEFVGRKHQHQLEGILAGRKILCETLDLKTIDAFIPPCNTWDNNTAVAMKQAGFNTLSADFYTYHSQSESLTHIPETIEPVHLGELLNENIPDGAVIVVMVHPHTFVQVEGHYSDFFGVDQFGDLLERISKREDLTVVSFQQLQQRVSLDSGRFKPVHRIIKARYQWGTILPHRKSMKPPFGGYYLEPQAYKKLDNLWISLTAAVITLAFAAGSILCWKLKRDCIVMMIAVLLMLCIIVKMNIVQAKGYHVSIQLMILLSSCVGIIISYSVKRIQPVLLNKTKSPSK